jgi:hypothetical protein
METAPDYQQGHLLVAAIRILGHAREQPPTMEEIGELLGISHEVVGVVARGLEGAGIVKIHMTPFDTRVEIADHTLLEDLPREEGSAVMTEELEEFRSRTEEKQAKMDELFGGGEYQKKKQEKHAGLDAQLKEWQEKRAIDPFAGSSPEGGGENPDENPDEDPGEDRDEGPGESEETT